MTTPRDEPCSRLHFDLNEHPENALKTLKEFSQRFELWYDTLYPYPPKVSLEAAIERWKISQATPENPSPKRNIEQFDEICEDTKSPDNIAKFWRIFPNWDHTYIETCKMGKSWVINNTKVEGNQLVTLYNITIAVPCDLLNN